MSLFEDTNPRALKELLQEIHNRVSVLPDFQRDFVWEPSATQELIVSIAYNYPAGSLLRVRDKQQVFAVREFEGAPELGNSRHTFLVLDGQQRLTSLYQAFFGVGDHRFYLKLDRLTEGAAFEDSIFYMRSTTRWAKAHEDFNLQADKLILPLSVLQDGMAGFMQWNKKAARRLSGQMRIDLEDALDCVQAKWVQTIDDYHFPVVTLSDTTQPDALCTIFETLNRTGVKLSVFELLTARFWPSQIRLRDLWEDAQARYPIISEFEVDPYYLLQAITLVSRDSPSCIRSAVLSLKPEDITNWWDRIVKGLAEGLDILREDCKVLTSKWLPYQTMLIPLAAVLGRSGSARGPLAGVQREKLKRWFWCAVFGQEYDTSYNSKAARDLVEIEEWFKEGPLPQTVSTLRFDPKALRDITPKQRALYRGTICLMLASGHGVRDFHTQSVITRKLMEEQGIDDHHIFPDAYLRKRGVALARTRDCVLNRTLIDRSTNQTINDRPPSQYLEEIRRTPGFPFESVLESHSLPAFDGSPLIGDDFEAFLAWRQDRIWAEIRRVTGLTEPSDLEASNGDPS